MCNKASFWNATHDLGKIGLSSIELRDIISFLSGRMKIMISSERILEPDLEMYRFNLSPDLMHDALAYSSLVISEGATLAAESGFLGIPTIYVNPQETCNNKELEENGCVVSLKDGRSVLECIKSIVSEPYLIREIKQRADSLVSSKINLTLFLIWFVSNFPESMVTMRENSDYQYNFK